MAALFLACGPLALATTIVGFRNPQGFVLAADSKLYYLGKPTGPEIGCKIFQSDSLYFTLSGVPGDKELVFAPATVFARSFDGQHSFGDNMKAAENALQVAIALYMTQLKVQDP